MGFNLEFFTNDKYKLLDIIYQNQVKVREDEYASLSQQEIADIAHFSKLKANQIINELIDIGCVEAYKNKRGKYTVTAKGLKVITLVKKQNA